MPALSVGDPILFYVPRLARAAEVALGLAAEGALERVAFRAAMARGAADGVDTASSILAAQIVPTVAAVDPALRQLDKVLADSGFYSDDAVSKIAVTCYVALGKQSHHRSLDAVLNPLTEPPALTADATPIETMRHRLATPAGKAIYRLRKQTVEPVFGIIKEAMGFRRFLLRGIGNVSLEWTLVTLAYNVRRLFSLINGKRKTGSAAAEKSIFPVPA